VEPNGVIQRRCATYATTWATEIVLMADLCLDEYTDHGTAAPHRRRRVDNDATLELYARIGIAQAEAGAASWSVG